MSTLFADHGRVINAQEPLPIPVDILTLLWENPDPSATFAAQTITINDADVDFFLIEFYYSSTANRASSYIVSKKFGNAWAEFQQGTGSPSGNLVYRNFRQANAEAGQLYFGNTMIGDSATSGYYKSDNSYLVPMRVWGFRKTIEMNNTGLRADAEYSTVEHQVGHWIDGKPVYEVTFSVDTTTSVGETYKDISSLGIRQVIKDDSFWVRTGGSHTQHNANWVYTSATDGTVTHMTSTWISSNLTRYYVRIDLDKTGVVPGTVYVTLRYTKNSDYS